MKNKLISMVDFVLSEDYNEKNNVIQSFRIIQEYATFLNTPLNISMFVPAIKVGDKWEVLEMPKDYDNYLTHKDFLEYGNKLFPKSKQYQTAKDNVIFEGFTCEKVKDRDEEYYIVNDSKGGTSWISWNDSKKISDLLYKNPTLTIKGVEESGLNK